MLDELVGTEHARVQAKKRNLDGVDPNEALKLTAALLKEGALDVSGDFEDGRRSKYSWGARRYEGRKNYDVKRPEHYVHLLVGRTVKKGSPQQMGGAIGLYEIATGTVYVDERLWQEQAAEVTTHELHHGVNLSATEVTNRYVSVSARGGYDNAPVHRALGYPSY